MLTPEDRQLVDNDVAIPGLAALLDGGTLAAALKAALKDERPRWGVHHVEVTYLRYKPGTNCLAACRLHTENGVELAYAKALHKLDNIHRSDDDHEIALPDLKIRLHRFPHDARLPALRKLCTPDERADLLRRLVPDLPELWQGTITPLHYKPERRLVARLDGDGMTAALKFYTADAFEQASAAAKHFSALEELRIPQRLGRSRRHGALALSWVQGRTLSRHLTHPAGQEMPQDLPMHAVGAALARIHAQEPTDLASFTAQDQIAAVAAAAEAVTVTAPWLAELAAELAYTVAARLRADDARHGHRGCAIHGDFSPDQILIGDDGSVAVLDFDNAALGHPATDLGSFAAALIQRSGAQAQVTGYIDQFHRGYHAAGGAPIHSNQITLYTAAALIRRAPEPFRYRHAAWGEETERVLRVAEDVMRVACCVLRG